MSAPTPLSPTPPSAPSPIATLAELTSSHDAILQKESRDRANLGQIANPDRATVRNTLLNWVSRGFPANFPLITMNVTPPPVCSDGVHRGVSEYVPYILGTTIGAQLVLLQPQLVGISLSSSIVGNSVRVLVSNS